MKRQNQGLFYRKVASKNVRFFLPEPWFKVARYSYSGSSGDVVYAQTWKVRHKQRFRKIATTVVLDKDDNLS